MSYEPNKNTIDHTIVDKSEYNIIDELITATKTRSVNLLQLSATPIENFSDGYHSFKELYNHRAILFSVICSVYEKYAWKSLLHDDGTMYTGMFIVGIETPDGQATYHYDLDYWDIFDVKVLERAPKWDGHTPDDALKRISKLTTRNS